MRLYLLKLLDEQPRHGYEILQLLSERLGGTYSPSPGTIYPRLRTMENDGLVRHATRGGRKVYSLTAAGRAEVAERADEVEALERDIRNSVTALADEISDDITTTVRDLRGEMTKAASQLGPQGGPRQPTTKIRGRLKNEVEWPEELDFGFGGMIDAQLNVLVARVRQLAAESEQRSDQVGAVATILDEAYRRIAEALTD